MKKINKNKAMLVYTEVYDLPHKDIEYYNRAEIFEDCVDLFEDLDLGRDYLLRIDYGVKDKTYVLVPQRALKRYHKIQLALGRLMYDYESDRQKGFVTQFDIARAKELTRLWNKYCSPTRRFMKRLYIKFRIFLYDHFDILPF